MSGGAGFVKTPDALLLDWDLSDGALRAYLVLASAVRTFSSDTMEMTAAQLGTLLNRSHDQANRWTHELEERGLLAVERNRGRNQPNRYTVLDPQGVVFANLHVVEGTRKNASPKADAKTRVPAHAKMREPYREEGEDERGQRMRGQPLPSPVDNGGAPRPPRPPQLAECDQHRGQPAHNCGPCRSEQIAGTGPPF